MSRNRGLAELLNDKQPAEQTVRRPGSRRPTSTADGAVAALDAKTPAAGPLAATLKSAAGDYARLVAAGRANSQGGWNRAQKAIRADEKTPRGRGRQALTPGVPGMAEFIPSATSEVESRR